VANQLDSLVISLQADHQRNQLDSLHELLVVSHHHLLHHILQEEIVLIAALDNILILIQVVMALL
jgi:hypothetical protein